MPGRREEVILRDTAILHFLPQITYLWVGGHEIYNFLSPSPTDATYQIWLSPVVLEKKMLTHEARRTMHDERCTTDANP